MNIFHIFLLRWAVIPSPPRLEERERKEMKQYTKQDFLGLAEDYYMDEPFGKGELLKDEMKRWTLQELQSWFGFTHRDDYTGDSNYES